MSTDLPTTLKRLKEARSPEEVFGGDPGDVLEDVKPVYLLLARIMHPDKHGQSEDAREATTLLNVWWDKAKEKFAQKTWGIRGSGVTITTSSRTYKNVAELAAGDICDVYLAEQDNGPRVVIKVGYPRDVDLVQNEARILKKLWERKDRPAIFMQQFLPKLVEQSRIVIDVKERWANVLEACEQGFTLEQVKDKYKDGLDPRHVAWIWKRLVEGMTVVHEMDVVHGAIVPSHVIVYPKNHGICILDWSYACTSPQALKAIVSKYKNMYPAEIKDKKPASPSLDVYMIAECMRYLLLNKDGKMPASTPPMFLSMLRACTLQAYYRSNDLKEIHEQLTENLRKTYGPRKFVELEM